MTVNTDSYSPPIEIDTSLGFSSYNNVERAIDLIPEKFKGKLSVEAFVETYSSGVQDVENLLTDILVNSEINEAEGRQLDILGDLFGESRKGRGDFDYRLGLKARIAVNTSNGTPDEILEILTILTGSPDVSIFEHYPSEFAVAATVTRNGGSLNAIDNLPPNIRQSIKEAGPIGVGPATVIVYLDDNALLGELGIEDGTIEVNSDGTAYDLIDNEGDIIAYQEISSGSGIQGLGVLSEITPSEASLVLSPSVTDNWFVVTETSTEQLNFVDNNDPVIVDEGNGGVLGEILQ